VRAGRRAGTDTVHHVQLGLLIPAASERSHHLEITALAYDVEDVVPGALYFCLPGRPRDGHVSARDAIACGAAALVVERGVDAPVPQIVVEDVRRTMAAAAARFNGNPSAQLEIVGVTGTNGKTTTACLVQALLEADGRQTGLITTVTRVIGGVKHPPGFTTPPAVELQSLLRAMVDAGDVACAMEASSHALELSRADSVRFAAAIFTNLTHDHLDFHGTMENYFQAKRRLFVDATPGHAIVNLDDPYGRRLADELEEPVTFAIERDAAFMATDVEIGPSGSRFTVHTPHTTLELRVPLPARFNVYNALGALAAASALGVPQATAAVAIAAVEQVPGRCQLVDEGQDFAVVVDYAHTPDSLENILAAAAQLVRRDNSGLGGDVWVVFGCGGDRDRQKRPLMGQLASQLADHVIVTSDNPRSEDPHAIIDEILAGAGDGVAHDVDRRAAITEALTGARAGDVVLIAGKGHERGQELEAGRTVPFDDVAVARAVLRRARRRAATAGRASRGK